MCLKNRSKIEKKDSLKQNSSLIFIKFKLEFCFNESLLFDISMLDYNCISRYLDELQYLDK